MGWDALIKARLHQIFSAGGWAPLNARDNRTHWAGSGHRSIPLRYSTFVMVFYARGICWVIARYPSRNNVRNPNSGLACDWEITTRCKMNSIFLIFAESEFSWHTEHLMPMSSLGRTMNSTTFHAGKIPLGRLIMWYLIWWQLEGHSHFIIVGVIGEHDSQASSLNCVLIPAWSAFLTLLLCPRARPY